MEERQARVAADVSGSVWQGRPPAPQERRWPGPRTARDERKL